MHVAFMWHWCGMYGEPSQSSKPVAVHSLPSTQKLCGIGVGAGVVVGIAVVAEDVTSAKAEVEELAKISAEVVKGASVEEVVGAKELVEEETIALEVEDVTAVDDVGAEELVEETIALEVEDMTAVDDEVPGTGVVVFAKLGPEVVVVC